MLEIDSDWAMTFTRGDDVLFELELVGEDDEPLNLTGCSVRSQVRAKPNGYMPLEFDTEIVDPAAGRVRFTASHEDTKLIRLTTAQWDVEITDSGGYVNTIIGPAPVEIIKDISI